MNEPTLRRLRGQLLPELKNLKAKYKQQSEIWKKIEVAFNFMMKTNEVKFDFEACRAIACTCDEVQESYAEANYRHAS